MDTQKKHKPRFSFEFFPPKTEVGAQKLQVVCEKLAAVNPSFFSVTYGAGGSTRDRTFATVQDVRKVSGICTAPHLSCVGDNRDELVALIKRYQSEGINRIVALRGDLPSGMGAADGDLKYASDLVRLIREETGDHFHIEVAAYPEKHPQAPTLASDLQAFKAKVDAGADSAITQYFYNVDAYRFFVDRCEKLGLDIPIIVGVMPIINYENLLRFSSSCGAEIPRWIRMQMESFHGDATSIAQLGEEIVTRFCEQLLAVGAPGIHFYTMNQAEPTLAIWNNLGIGKR
ncbi:5,10-methylenetetrahydrofolate reductase oxidoreductase [gamma proteobacterium HdN1]|nr:5,10-methylenetetrahydrofolate reductase oxidoreductase [gamma proteobacterium HdN1]